MKLNPRSIILLILLAVPFFGFSQTDTTSAPNTQQHSAPAKPKKNIMDRLYIGGNIGFWFGNTTYIAVSPIVGYRWTENFTAGVGFTYQYWKDNYNNYPASNLYGGLLFGRYNIFKGVFLECDYELNNLDAYAIDASGNYISTRKWVSSLLVGGGYSGGGSRGGAYFSILYDVLQDPYSPYYGVPVIRAGVGFGI